MEGKETVPSRPANPAIPYREDCWSEGETWALVDAWGDRYLELNRGNLRQKQWQEVADAVNSRAGAERRPMRTDVQCKNRIDTLKKKLKIEKAKITESSAYISQWPFFDRLDAIIGPSATPASGGGIKKPSPSRSPPLALPLPFHKRGTTPLPAAAPVRFGEKRPAPPVAAALPIDNSFIRKAAAAAAAAATIPVTNSFVRKAPPAAAPAPKPSPPVDNSFIRKAAAAAAAAAKEEPAGAEETDESESGSRSISPSSGKREKERRGGDGIMEVARAIERVAEMYERVELERQKQMMELEKQRMELLKGLELQRMQMFADLQVQIEKIKRVKRSDPGELIRAALPLLSNPSFFS